MEIELKVAEPYLNVKAIWWWILEILCNAVLFKIVVICKNYDFCERQMATKHYFGYKNVSLAAVVSLKDKLIAYRYLCICWKE